MRGKNIVWTKEHEQIIKAMYLEKSYSQLSEMLGIHKEAIKDKAYRLGLKKDKESISKINRATRGDRSGEKNANWKGGISQDNYRYKKIQIERYPEKIKCREKTKLAILSGEIKKTPCVFCGEEDVVAHHKSYDDYKNVIFVCRHCHRYKCHNGKY